MITYKNLRIIPSYHSNLDFVYEVRKAFYLDPPDAIAIEFPEDLQQKIIKAINRLPQISIVLYYDQFLRSQIFVPVDGTDAMIEVLRLSIEYGLPYEFIDLFVKNYAPEVHRMPDSYALEKLGLDRFYNEIKNSLKLEESAIERKKKFDKKIEDLEQIEREKENLTDNIGDIDFIENVSEFEINDTLYEEPKSHNEEKWLKDPEEIDEFRDQYMAMRLHHMMGEYDKILVVIGLSHWERIKIILEHDDFNEELFGFSLSSESKLFNIMEKDLPKTVLETPNIMYQWELFREDQKEFLDDFDFHSEENKKVQLKLQKFNQFDSIRIIYAHALNKYKEEYDETIAIHKLQAMMQYLRNLPLIDNLIRPQLFDIVLAAKSIINDDFAWIVWDECKKYPFAKEDLHLDNLDLTKRGVFLNGKYFKIRRNIPITVRKIKIPLKPQPKEKREGEWREQWDKGSWNLVSYIPEDIFEENYFQHVRLRSKNILKEQFHRTHEFKSSLMDGIAFRETIQKWAYSNHKIFVKEQRKIRGEVDSVVIIFDEDAPPQSKKLKWKYEEKYPYKMIWHAEHHNESDLVLYSTYPGEILVGPGISKVEMGGVASFFPPRRIPDVWRSKFIEKYSFVKKKSEVLLLSALLYADKRYITYIAKKKPRYVFYQLAKKLFNEIIFIPIDRFNPVSIHALRNIHILAGRSVREYAHKYIKRRRY